MIDATEGKVIEEADDLDKKLALLNEEIESQKENFEIEKIFTKDVLVEIVFGWLKQLLNLTIQTTQKFNQYYKICDHGIRFKNLSISIPFKDESIEELLEFIEIVLIEPIEENNKIKNEILYFKAKYSLYKKGGTDTFDCNYTFQIDFQPSYYLIKGNQFNSESGNNFNIGDIKRLYHQPLTEEEMKLINRAWGDLLYDHLEYNYRKIKGKDKLK